MTSLSNILRTFSASLVQLGFHRMLNCSANQITLIKKKEKFPPLGGNPEGSGCKVLPYTGRLTVYSYMTKYLCISSYMRKLFLIYDFATAPIWILLDMRKIIFFLLSVYRSHFYLQYVYFPKTDPTISKDREWLYICLYFAWRQRSLPKLVKLDYAHWTD